MNLDKLGILPATGYPASQGKLFSDLAYNTKIPTYAGLPIEEIQAVSKQMYDNYNANLANKDSLDILINQIPLLPNDDKYKKEQVSKIKNLFNEIQQNGNWEDAQYLVQQSVKDMTLDPALNAAKNSYQNYINYKTKLDTQVSDGTITKEAANKELSKAINNYDKQGGVYYDDKLGLYTGEFSGYIPPKYEDIGKILKTEFKDWKETDILGLVTGNKITNFEKTPGGYLINGTSSLITDEEVQNAMRNYISNQSKYKESLDYYSDLQGRNGVDVQYKDLLNLGITEEELKEKGYSKEDLENNQEKLNKLYDNVNRSSIFNEILSSSSAPISHVNLKPSVIEDKLLMAQVGYNYDIGKINATGANQRANTQLSGDLNLRNGLALQEQKSKNDIKVAGIKAGTLNADGSSIVSEEYTPLATVGKSVNSVLNFPEVFNEKEFNLTSSSSGNSLFGISNSEKTSNPNYKNIHDFIQGKIKVDGQNGTPVVATKGLKTYYDVLVSNGKIKGNESNEIVMKLLKAEHKKYSEQNPNYTIYAKPLTNIKGLEEDILGKNIGTETKPNFQIGKVANMQIGMINKVTGVPELMSLEEASKKLSYNNSKEFLQDISIYGQLQSSTSSRKSNGELLGVNGLVLNVKNPPNGYSSVYIADDGEKAKVNLPLATLTSVLRLPFEGKSPIVEFPALRVLIPDKYGNPIFEKFQTEKTVQYDDFTKKYGIKFNLYGFVEDQKILLNNGTTKIEVNGTTFDLNELNF